MEGRGYRFGMRAITIREPGGPEALEWLERDDPVPADGEVVVAVAATAVNRADLLQRQGFYPPPKGETDIPGLECSGTIVELGPGVTGWQVGDQVCALVAGGGYAERVAVPQGQLLPIPDGVDLVTAAALPEVTCTVWSNVVLSAGLREHEVLLVHGGAGGVGSCAIQVGKALGATVAVTAGSAEKLARCRELGADIAINYREQDFVAELREATGGADVILDNMGASYLDRNVDALRPDGRLLVIGFQGGVKGELNLGKLLGKRGTITSLALRSRPREGRAGKAAIVADVRWQLWPRVERGEVRPIVGATFPITQAADAHRALEAGDVVGKILLTIP